MQHLGYDVAHWQAPMAYFHCCQHWYRCKLSPWGCSSLHVLDVSYVSVGTELLKLPGVDLLHLICLGLLSSFSLPGFHFSTELQCYGLYSLLKMFRESKWEHKFCISKGRNGPIVLHRVELLLFSSVHYRSACVNPDPFSFLFYGFSIFSAIFFYAEICCLCKMGHVFLRCV